MESVDPPSSGDEVRHYLQESTTNYTTMKRITSHSITSSSLITNQQNMCPAWVPGSPQLLWCRSPPTECDTLASSWLTISYVCTSLLIWLFIASLFLIFIGYPLTESATMAQKPPQNYILIKTTSIETNCSHQKDSRAANPSNPLQ